jgi:hypothetical protein
MKSRTTKQNRSGEQSGVRLTTALALSVGLIMASTLAASTASAQIVPGGSVVEGKTIGDWGFEWWQRFFGHTSTDPVFDTTGAFQNVDQTPPVFFACAAGGPAGGVAVTRNFTVPADQHILVSLMSIGVWWEPADGADFCPVVVPGIIDATTALSFSLDGVPISQANLFNNHREPSTLNLTTVVAVGNPFAPDGVYPGSCSDGFFVMIEPLSPGEHIIECGFTHPQGGLLNHTNVITVLPAGASVPSVSPLGLAVLMLLFTGVGVWVLRNHAQRI